MDKNSISESASRVCGESPKKTVKTGTTRPWFLNIGIPRRPRCPGCGGQLLQRAVFIARDVVWCEVCGERASRTSRRDSHFRPDGHPGFYSTDTDRFVPYLLALASLAGPSEITRARGVIFWTPPTDTTCIDSYLRWLELHGRKGQHVAPISDIQATAMLDAFEPAIDANPIAQLSDSLQR